MQINNFRGELTDISAKKEALATTTVSIWSVWYANLNVARYSVTKNERHS